MIRCGPPCNLLIWTLTRDGAQQRSYHAWFSRFDQADPSDSSYDLSDPQSLNRYAYTRNDPINFIDPNGLNMASVTCQAYGWFPTDGRGNPTGPQIGDDIVVCVIRGGGGGGRMGGGGGGSQSPAGPVVDESDLGPPPNPNCITRAVAGGKLGTTRNLIPELRAVPGRAPVLTGRAAHDGIHVYAPAGGSAPVAALPAMAGGILWGNRQGKVGTADYHLGVMDILLNRRINGQQYVMTLKDLNYDDMQRSGNVRPGGVIGSVDGSANTVGETGLHVTLMPYSVYQSHMGGRPTGPKRASVPFGSLMDAARNPASPFRCP